MRGPVHTVGSLLIMDGQVLVDIPFILYAKERAPLADLMQTQFMNHDQKQAITRCVIISCYRLDVL